MLKSRESLVLWCCLNSSLHLLRILVSASHSLLYFLNANVLFIRKDKKRWLLSRGPLSMQSLTRRNRKIFANKYIFFRTWRLRMVKKFSTIKRSDVVYRWCLSLVQSHYFFRVYRISLLTLVDTQPRSEENPDLHYTRNKTDALSQLTKSVFSFGV